MTASDKLRLFVAIDIPREQLETVAAAAAPLEERWPQARWTPIENQHVTLKFLGWMAQDALRDASSVCRDAAARHERASLRLVGFGSFPSSRRVRVLWVGIDDPENLLGSLAAALESGFARLGFPPEERDFRPHLTLARFKVPQRIEEPLPPLGPLEPFEVGSLVLYRSHLSPRGPRYEPLTRFDLGAGGGAPPAA